MTLERTIQRGNGQYIYCAHDARSQIVERWRQDIEFYGSGRFRRIRSVYFSRTDWRAYDRAYFTSTLVARASVALADRALQAEHGLDQLLPWRMAQPRLDRKHREFTSFTSDCGPWLCSLRSRSACARWPQFELAAQVGLVVFAG